MMNRSTPWRRDRRFVAQPMSKWLAPRQLVKTGGRAVLSQLFGKYADRREIIAGSRHHGDEAPDGVWRAAGFSKDMWIDFLADTGDGFDPTYAIAKLVGAETISLAAALPSAADDLAGPVPERLPRGSLLIMGGDEVYPDASDVEYRNRTVGPFELALPWADDPSHLFAIPGNHDWYDGLTAFLRQFCDGRWIGGWKTHQRLSYWAVLLPHRWWIWGIDIAFDSKIDTAQLDYFRTISGIDAPADRYRAGPPPQDGLGPAELLPGDNVILCSAKPSWLDMTTGDEAEHDNLRFFIDTIIQPNDRLDTSGNLDQPGTGVNVRMLLSGDKHFYCRHQRPDSAAPPAPADAESPGDAVSSPSSSPDHGVGIDTGRLPAQLITAGGGGAYLSSTKGVHEQLALRNDRDEAEPIRFASRRIWPTADQSVGLVWKRIFWQLPTRNGLLPAVVAGLHLLIAVCVWGRAASKDGDGWAEGIDNLGVGDAFAALVTSAPAWVLFIVLAAGGSMWAGAKQKGGAGRRFALGAPLGIPHAMAHMTVATIVLFLAACLVTDGFGWTGNGGVVAVLIVVFLLSLATATLVLALYLAIAHSFGRNLNDASVAIQHTGFKNFIRIHLDGHGDMHLFMLGLRDVDKTALTWSDAGVPQPTSPEPQACTLIDAVTVHRRPPLDGSTAPPDG